MRIVSINGSMMTQDPTEVLIDAVVARLRHHLPEVEHQSLSVNGMNIMPCEMTCAEFCSSSGFTCRLDDDVNQCLRDMEAADVVLIGAPLYFRVPSAKFHTLAERLIAIFYNMEKSGGVENVHSPLYNKPCVLIGVAEYTSPNHVLEYLQEFCHVLKMRPVMLPRFPYLGIGAQGPLANDRVYQPLDRAQEMGDAVMAALQIPPRPRAYSFANFDDTEI